MEPASSSMLRAFGGVAASGPTGNVDLGGPKQRAVLGLLLLEAQSVVPLDRIIDRIWGDAPPARAEVSVRGYVSNLRKALGRAGFDPHTVIEFRDRGYVLQVPPEAVDLHRFDALVDDGERRERLGDLEGACTSLVKALDTYSGDPLGPAAEALQLADVRTRFEERRGDAVEMLAAVRLTLGQHARLPGDLAAEIVRQPYRERLRAQLALALYRSGRPVEALRTLDEARRLLLEDIGVDPGPELRDLEAAILAHDESILAWTSPTGASPRGTVPAEPPGLALPPEEPPRFGRSAEDTLAWTLLDRLPQRGGVLVVSGEAGIGKSTILNGLSAEARRRGIVVGWDRCPESAAGAPYRSWRAAVEALLPGGAMTADPAAPDDERVGTLLANHLNELERLRDRREPAVVIVDDLQWADDASLSFLEFLAPELERLRLLLAVGVRRAGAAELLPQVRDCLVELMRTSDPVAMTLQGLTAVAVAEWVEARTATPPFPGLVEHLISTTGGNPFYVRELLAVLEADGQLTGEIDFGALRTGVPHAVQDVVRRRTSRLPPDTQALLTVAAVIGRRFDLDLLAGMLDLDPAITLGRLEPALDDGLVEPDDEVVGRFAFSHALVSSTLVAEQNAARLAAHHARATSVLEALRAADLDPWVEDLAHHATEGLLAGTAAKAVEYALRAADAAEAAQSAGDAAVQVARAVSAASLIPDFPAGQRRELVRRLGETQRDCGDPAGRATLVEAARLAEAQGDPEAVAAILANLDDESLWAGYDWNLFDQSVVALVERVLAGPGLSEVARAQLTMALAGELVYLDSPRSAALFAEAHDLAQRLGESVLAARTLIHWFWSVSGPSGMDVRASIGDQLIALADAGSLPPRLRPLAHLARVSAAIEIGDGTRARSCISAARRLAHPVRTPTGWAHLQYAEAGLALVDGDLERARAHALALRPALQRVRRYTADASPASVLAVVATEAGRYDEALEWLATFEESPFADPIQWARAWTLAEAGRDDDARAALARFDGPLPDDWLWVPLTTAAVLAAARVGDQRFLRRHLPSLEPWADRFAALGEGGMVLGPVGFAVASGHAALGELDQARAVARTSLEIAQRLGAVRWIPRVEALLASLPQAV